MDSTNNYTDTNYGIAVAISSFLAFFAYSMILENLLTMPDIVVKKKKKERFINMIITSTHAVIAATWALYCFYIDENLVLNMLNQTTVPAYLLCCFSCGYFMHDTLLNIRHRSVSDCWEILLHHAIVISCFGSSVVAHYLVSFTTVALLVEVNSIFLHARQLFNLLEIPKKSVLYRLNAILNILSYIVFRIYVIGWMARWLILHFDFVLWPYNIILTIGIPGMMVIFIILFGRILIRDYWIFIRTNVSDIQLKKSN